LSQEAGAALFQGLRLHLTLWYCGVLSTALVLFGVSLYLGSNYFLLTPIENDTVAQTQGHVQQWLVDPLDHGCPSSVFPGPPGQNFQMRVLVVCFDRNGSLLPNENTAGLPAAFLTTTLAKSALQTGQPATDIVNGGGTFGSIYRSAQVVPNPSGSGISGVIVVGESIQAQEYAISLLLYLLLAVGNVALLAAGVGGLFLSKHALAPARLAWTNQQRFIADASHELRTPLTLLRANAEVLLRGRERLEAEDAALLEDSVAETNHMARLLNNMLTLARLDSSSSHREHEVLNLTDVTLAGVRRVQALADQVEISMQVEANEKTVVIGDPAQLEQAVLALLDNAIKYNRQGGRITVRTAVKDEQALLEVEDTGIGMAAEHLSHLGERFYRVDKARSREAGGTGLGLSIVRSIAVVHGGTLTITSVPEQGTTVTFTLPLAYGALRDRLRDRAAGNISSLPERTS
jgi:signal transduction histidine kinase